jgi:O-antigen polymerase
LLAVCLVLPWLNGFTAGPTPNFWPWWLSAVCAVGIALGWRRVSASWLAQTWLAAALISSLLALLQYFGWAAALSPWLSPTLPGEAFANLRQRNQFASLTSIGLVALLACVAWQKTSLTAAESAQRLSRPWPLPLPMKPPSLARGGIFLGVLLLALGNAASSSRTGLLQWLLILLLTLWWNRGQRRPVVVLAVLALLLYGAAVLLLPRLLKLTTDIGSAGLWGRLTETGSDSRRVLWDNVLTLIGQKPWFGWGWGELDYAHALTDYGGPRFTELLGNAHNLPLHLAVELGLPVTALLGLGLAWAVRRAAPWRDTEPARQMAWAVLAVIGVHSLLEYPLWYGPFQLASCLAVAFLWRGQQQGNGPRWGAARLLIATAAWLALGYIGFDYARVTQLYVPVAKRWPATLHEHFDSVPASGLFAPQLDFARLLTTEVTPANAPAMQALALRVLHYSPEAKVFEKLLTSALLAGQRADADFYLARFRWAYPRDCALWSQANTALLAAHAAP